MTETKFIKDKGTMEINKIEIVIRHMLVFCEKRQPPQTFK